MEAAALRRRCTFLALLLCFRFLQTTQAFKLHLHGGGGFRDEKVPSLTVIVPDPSPSPELSPLAAPPPVTGADGDMRPRLPTERWRRGRGEERRGSAHEQSHAHAPAGAAAAARAPLSASAPAPAPDSGSGGTAFIRSSPAVPVPRGVTDTATILPMPAPAEKRQDVGGATSVRAGMAVVVSTLMIASFGVFC